MRPAVAAPIALGAVFALAGCAGFPSGTDGNLTNGWPAMPRATITVPVVGACHLTDYVGTGSGDFGVVPCATETHYVETAYVDAFTGADAQQAEPPAYDSPAMPGIYSQCQKGADDYLGGDWHIAYLELGIVVPDMEAWRGGARWFRCDLTYYSGLSEAAIVDHGVLTGDLAGPPHGRDRLPVHDRGRDNARGDRGDDQGLRPAAHRRVRRYLHRPDVPFSTDRTARDRMLSNGCRPVVASFVCFSNADQWQNTSVSWWSSGASPVQWRLGDRVTRCFAYAFTNSGSLEGSVKGIKNQTPKG